MARIAVGGLQLARVCLEMSLLEVKVATGLNLVQTILRIAQFELRVEAARGLDLVHHFQDTLLHRTRAVMVQGLAWTCMMVRA